MFKAISHYLYRTKELGPLGALRRIWVRTIEFLISWGQTGWYGLKASKGMSDAALLAHTEGSWKTIDDLLDQLADRPGTSFFFPHESVQNTVSHLNRDYPEYVSTILAKADAICTNNFTLLGQVFHFSGEIDWQADPVTSQRFPTWHRSRINNFLYSPQHPADPIFLWELNRHQHFITLGIAYWLTGDQRYVETFVSQIQSWIADNPIQHGIHWFYPLEISIRLIAWTAAFQFFRDSQIFRQKIGKTFLKSLWQQVDFLSQHLQNTRTDVPNNHMMAELTGLVLVGLAFPEFRSSQEWVQTGLRYLNQQAIAQTHPDGVNKEQATGYHRFVTELLLLIIARSRQGKLAPQATLENALKSMLDYVFFISSPDGSVPMWGDADFGHALGLGQNNNFWDFRPLLSAGAVLFDRSDWKYISGRFDEEAFWLLGPEGLEHWKQLDAQKPEQTSRGFPQSGLYILRDTWDKDADVACLRCGPFGLGGEGHCAHAHNDLLSFSLWINGQPLLVDSGTYTYHGEWRDHFRLTSAHNTVLIDDFEQAIPMRNFNWQHICHSKCIDFSEKSVIGELVYPNNVKFLRELTHSQKGVWEVKDEFIGEDQSHAVSWFFHFSPHLELQWDEALNCGIIRQEENPCFWIYPPKGIDVQIKSDWFSRNYGKKEANPLLLANWKGKISQNHAIFLWKFVSVKKGF